MHVRGGDNGAHGLVFAEEFRVDLVDRAPVRRAWRVDAAGDDLIASGTCGFEHAVKIVERLAGMGANVALSDFTGVRINLELSGDVEHAVANYGGTVVSGIVPLEGGGDDFHGEGSK